jgi:hypothetical protein
MLFWTQASLRLLLCAARTFWGDATVWFDFSFWFDVSYCSNVPSDASFRVAPFAASHGPVEDRLALGLGALGEHLKSCPSVSFDTFATHAVRLRSGNSAEIKSGATLNGDAPSKEQPVPNCSYLKAGDLLKFGTINP